jgi:hypothetical protein
MALQAAGKYPEALAEVRGLTLEGDPAAPEALHLRADLLYKSGNMVQAEQMYKEVRNVPNCFHTIPDM